MKWKTSAVCLLDPTHYIQKKLYLHSKNLPMKSFLFVAELFKHHFLKIKDYLSAQRETGSAYFQCKSTSDQL